eukprot:TRINITY_DN4620_c0_g1_i2.p1 TRINITY_DN4620_c0_g1~~TRINITY_DN4620_c0_g1_i2.p1  ORF type:complete len:221 (-),score=33.99 TRINITY_DN4620_c0_g1_i2:87-749(-)
MSAFAPCPICGTALPSDQNQQNAHIDECLTFTTLKEEENQTHISIDLSDADYGLSIEDDVSTNDSVITCPYPGCGNVFPSYDIVNHSQSAHKACDQRLACPICTNQGNGYTINDKTNLLQHLQAAHASDLQLQQAMMASKESYIKKMSGRVDLPSKVTGSYTSSKTNCNIDHECPICFDDMVKGENIAWLECFCTYHVKCIDAWYKKSGKQICPVHTDDT